LRTSAGLQFALTGAPLEGDFRELAAASGFEGTASDCYR